MPSALDLFKETSEVKSTSSSEELSYSFTYGPKSEPYKGYIESAQRKYKVPKGLLPNMFHLESSFNPKAIGPETKRGRAMGIGQIMPSQHPDVDPEDPVASIDYIAKYLRQNYDRLGSWEKAIAAHNMGPNNVKKYGPRGLPETKSFLENLDKAKIVKEMIAKGIGGKVKAVSALDLFDKPSEPTVEPEVPKLEMPKTVESKATEHFYGSYAVSAPVQPLIPFMWNPEVASHVGKMGFGPVPEGGWREDGVPLNKRGDPYYRPEKISNDIAGTFQMLAKTVATPEGWLGIAQGGFDFLLSLPGFATGMLSAASGTLRQSIDAFITNFNPLKPVWEQTGDLTLNDLYDTASMEMQKSMEFFEPAKKAMLGEITPEAQTALQVALVPLTVPSMAGQKLSTLEVFKDHPNVQGALKFTGDALGFMTMALAYHGGSRGRFAEEIGSVVKEANEIAEVEQKVQAIPDEILRRTEELALGAKKQQVELRAAEIAKRFEEDSLIHEEQARQAEEIAKAKMRPITSTGLEKAKKRDIQIALGERLSEDIKPEYEFTSKKGNYYFKSGDQWYDKDRLPVSNHFVKRAAEKGKVHTDFERTEIEPGSVEIVPKATYPAKGPKPVKVKPKKKVKEKVTPESIIDFAIDGIEKKGLKSQFDARNLFLLKVRKKARLTDESFQDLFLRPEYTEDFMPKIDKAFRKGATVKQISKVADMFADEVIKKIYPERTKIEQTIPEPDRSNEPVTEVDRKTGVDLPEMRGEKSPFHQDKETTVAYMKVYNDPVRSASIESDPDLFVQKLINDGNRFFHGDKRVNIDQIRKMMSMLSERAEELRGEFLTGVDFMQWKETVDEASRWLRDLDIAEVRKGDVIRRRKIDPTEDGPKVHSQIPISELTGEARKAAELAKEFGLRLLGFEDGMAWYGMLIDPKLDPPETTLATFGASREKLMKSIKNAEEGFKIKKGEHLRYPDIYTDPKEYTKGLREEGVKLFSGIDPREVIKSAKRVADYTSKARGMKAFKPKEAAKMTKEEAVTALVDKSGNIRKQMLMKLGDEGYRIVQKMVLTRGSSSLAARKLKQMQNEVFGGLSGNEKKILDDLILSLRMKDIGGYKSEKQYKFPLKLEDFVRFIETYRYKDVNGLEDLTGERAELLMSRAKAYDNYMTQAVEDMYEAGLISEAERGELASHYYRKTKLVNIFDQRYRAKVGKKRMTVYDSGVESLARGRETDIYEPSSEIMALETFNRAYGRILNNKAGLSLLDLAERDPLNSFARVKGDEPIPSGWSRIFVFKDGKRKAVYLSKEMSKEWINSSPDMSYRLGQLVRWISGAPVLRMMATGINWGFALANLPRDVMHIWYAARVFEGENWKPLYSSHAPIYGMQMTRDLVTTFSDALLRKGRYEDYINEGGGMEFLVHQGRLFQRGRHLEGKADKVLDFLGYLGETSEIMTRLSIRESVIRRRAKERKLSMEEARKNKEITDEATFTARDYMDFGQGGWAVKAFDNGLPYFNAAVQGGRGLFRAFKDNPIASTYKMAQFAAAVSGLTIAMGKMSPKTKEALQGNIDMQNNICIPLGDEFGFEDSHGQMRYPYLKMPLDPSQKFFKTFFEACTDKWLGNEIDVDRVVDSLKEFSPTGVTEMPPFLSALLGYVTNKDFWLNEDIWKKTDKPFSYPFSSEEYSYLTPEFYKDVGAKTELSPERMRYAVEELTTKGTMWSYLLGEGYKAMFGDMPKDMSEKHLAEVLAKKPIIRRFFGITNPYSQYASSIEKAKQASELDVMVQNRGLDLRVDGYLYQKNTSKKEIGEYIRSFKDLDVVDRLFERFRYSVEIKDLKNRSFWLRLKGLDTKARAKVFYHRWESLSPLDRKDIQREMAIVDSAGGVITENFLNEVGRLRRSPEKPD